METLHQPTTSDRELVITRTFNAPRELVFSAWTDPEHIGKWWGPNGFTITTHSMEPKPGGVWKFIMHGPDGTDYPNEIFYDEIVPPERIVYSHSGGDEGPDDAQFQAFITFVAEGNKTHLTMRSVFRTAAERDHVVRTYGAIEGGNQTLARLEDYLEGRS